jgi:hypothetical protein
MSTLKSVETIQAKINEFELIIKKKEKIIADDKKDWNCLNHEVIYAEIRILLAKKLSLYWAIGETNCL